MSPARLFSALFLVILALTGPGSVIAGSSVTLAWDANAEPDVTGYRLLYGNASGNYALSQDAGNATTTIIPNLTPGATYFFVVTAYNSAGLESLPSNEVSYLVPVVSPTPTPTPVPTATPTPTATPPPPPPTPTPTPPLPTPTPGPTATPEPTITPDPVVIDRKGLLNVSTRVSVQRGEDLLIGGVIITGDDPKKVVLRAVGPSLAAAGVAGALTDPMLRLHDSTGALLISNDNWRTGSAELEAMGLAPSDEREAGMVATLAPGAYTAVVSGATGGRGIALFELYDAEPAKSQIVNISTRGRVEAGDNVMIGGFIIGGDQPSQVVVRAVGPSLAAYGVAGAMDDPVLELYNSSGSLIYGNDNWGSNQGTQIAASALAPTDSREAAILANLPPGNYTAIVRGANHSTGVCVVEVYYIAQ